MIKVLIYIFLHFCTRKVFPGHLAKFQSITKYRTHIFWTFISVNRRSPLIFLVPILGWLFEKMKSCSQKYRTDWNYNKKWKIARIQEPKVLFFFVWIAVLIVIIISIWGHFWENEVIYSNFQPKIGTRKINGGAKFSEIMVQRTRVEIFVIDWNLARYLGKTYCVRKRKKIDIENLIIAAL